MNGPVKAVFAGVLAIACAAAGYLAYQWQSGSGRPDAAVSGQLLLATSLTGLDDQPQVLTQWRGKVMVVNFWATWCAPCREEIPGFIKVQDLYRGRGVQFVGIAIDHKNRVEPYAKDIGMNYPVLLGGIYTMDIARQVGNRLDVLPFTVVLDRSGKVAETIVGILKPEKLEKILESLL